MYRPTILFLVIAQCLSGCRCNAVPGVSRVTPTCTGAPLQAEVDYWIYKDGLPKDTHSQVDDRVHTYEDLLRTHAGVVGADDEIRYLRATLQGKWFCSIRLGPSLDGGQVVPRSILFIDPSTWTRLGRSRSTEIFEDLLTDPSKPRHPTPIE